MFRWNGKISILRLNKIVYISHGWHLAMHNEPLFLDRIEAWKYGPIVPSLYYASKYYGNGKYLYEPFPGEDPLDEKTTKFLNLIYKYYGKLRPLNIATLVGNEGTPYDKIHKKNKNDYLAEIPNKDIFNFYTNFALENGINYG